MGANQTAGLGYLDTGKTEGLGFLNTGLEQGQGYLDQAGLAFQPLGALGQKYGNATTMLQNSLGLGGAAGNQAAVGAFQAGPGYQFAMDQGLGGLARQRATGGMGASGNADADAMKYAQGLANQEYGNWQKNLGQFLTPELQATAGTAAGQAGALGQQANLANQANTNMANLTTTDAFGRVNLGNMTTQGMNQANTQEANAKMAASGNLWGAIGGGLSALTGAAGQAGGFKTLFG